MVDLQCRVTVVGTVARVDAAVPARAAIAEYVDSLAALCEQPESDVLPAAWTLGTADQRALAPSSSLSAAGIVDGQVLYLRDLTAGEYDEPLDLEVDEIVAGAAGRSGGPRWDARARSATALFAGVLWLVASTAAWLLDTGRPVGPAGPLSLLAGLLPAVLAWTAGRGRPRIAESARLAMALCAVPCLGVAGWFLSSAGSAGRPGSAAVGLSVAATVGAVVALSAVPGTATLSVLLLAALFDAVTGVLAAFNAGPAEYAAVIALLGYLVLACAPVAAGWLAAAWSRLGSGADGGDTEQVVLTARRLVAGAHATGSVLLALALVSLGRSQNRYAFGLAVCLSIAVLLRAGACRFAVDAVPQVAAGLTGLFAAALNAPETVRAPGWVPAAAGLAIGVTGLLTGVLSSLRGPAGQEPVRAAWSRIAVTLCSVAALPLAIGVFGVFTTMVGLGRRM